MVPQGSGTLEGPPSLTEGYSGPWWVKGFVINLGNFFTRTSEDVCHPGTPREGGLG